MLLSMVVDVVLAFLSFGAANLLNAHKGQNHIVFLLHLVHNKSVVSVLYLSKKRKFPVYNFKHYYCCI